MGYTTPFRSLHTGNPTPFCPPLGEQGVANGEIDRILRPGCTKRRGIISLLITSAAAGSSRRLAGSLADRAGLARRNCPGTLAFGT